MLPIRKPCIQTTAGPKQPCYYSCAGAPTKLFCCTLCVCEGPARPDGGWIRLCINHLNNGCPFCCKPIPLVDVRTDSEDEHPAKTFQGNSTTSPQLQADVRLSGQTGHGAVGQKSEPEPEPGIITIHATTEPCGSYSEKKIRCKTSGCMPITSSGGLDIDEGGRIIASVAAGGFSLESFVELLSAELSRG